MANNIIISKATIVNHVVAGAAILNGNMSLASDITTQISGSNSINYPLSNIILTFTPSAITSVGDTIDLFKRDLNISGVNDEPTPKNDFKSKFVGSFRVDVDTVIQYIVLNKIELSTNCEFYIFNNLKSVDISSWSLDVEPYTYGTL